VDRGEARVGYSSDLARLNEYVNKDRKMIRTNQMNPERRGCGREGTILREGNGQDEKQNHSNESRRNGQDLE